MTTDTIEKMSQRRTRAGIVVWDGPRPKDDDEYDEQFWDKLRDSLAAIHLDFRPVTGSPCDDCGCLLSRPDELCPNCVRPWMYAQEKAWRERPAVIYYTTTHGKKAA